VTRSDESARLRLLFDLGSAFAARIELDELVPLVMTKCREALDAEGAAVLLLDSDSNQLYFPYAADEDEAVTRRLSSLRFPADQGIAGHVLHSGHSLRVDDVEKDPRFYRGIDRESGLTTRNMICSPLTARHGVIGLIQVVNHRGAAPFDDDDLQLLDTLAGSIAVAIENARLYARSRAAEEQLRAQVGALRRDLAHHDRFGDIVGSGPAMLEVFRLMETAAASPIAVLIEGETGTGKEVAARGIHRASVRAEGPFVAVNCAALPEHLLESELFGHRRGAFTGATHDHRGLFEAAHGGTILLDEVGDMPPAMQAKLLRVLQEGEVVPVGETRPRKVDVRVISATNRDLSEEVATRRFRDDLYYRIVAFPIRLPPLRERREDVPLLAARFVKLGAERHGKQIGGIDRDALECLTRHEWRGNIRELQNEIERAVALAQAGAVLGVEHLSAKLRAAGPDVNRPLGTVLGDPERSEATSPAAASPPPPASEVPPIAGGSLRRARASFEAEFIRRTLTQLDGNVSRAAQALGLSRVMLQRKMKAYNLR